MRGILIHVLWCVEVRVMLIAEIQEGAYGLVKYQGRLFQDILLSLRSCQRERARGRQHIWCRALIEYIPVVGW